MSDDLKERWKEVWQRLHAAVLPHVVFDELIQAYSASDRFYHNRSHIENCLARFDQTRSLAVHPEEVELALWFHDAVYDARGNDNEQKSAEWAERVIDQVGLPRELAERVSRLILATRHDADADDADVQLMVDIDLAILGAEPESFWQYEENIRKEYAWVPEDQFRVGRTNILRSFLDRRYIYYHTPYRQMFEQKARLNLQQALEKLADVRCVTQL